jgi:hypothetical protein
MLPPLFTTIHERFPSMWPDSYLSCMGMRQNVSLCAEKLTPYIVAICDTGGK